MADLRRQFGTKTVTIRTVIYFLRNRAYMLLIILLSLPFLLPLPIPGLSTPFGFAIGLVALRLALGQRPWLPKSIQRREIPPGFFPKLLDHAAKIIRLFERFLRPRWLIATESALIRQLHAVVLLGSAIILLLPLPIPFSNGLPAWSILLIAGGLMERDGFSIFLGYLVFALAVAYLWLFGEAAQVMAGALWRWLRD